ncbi:MAG TPA: response regulator, partial [Opitutaceae bacterium]
ANPTDLVISDIGLPGASGLDLMVKLRSMRRVPGIALTGFGMENDVVRTEGAGFAAHLTKPITVEALEDAIATALKS